MKLNMNFQIESSLRGVLETEECRVFYSELVSYFTFVLEF